MAFDAYLTLEGISGNTPTRPIQLTSFQFGIGRGISSPTGSSADRESSAPSVSEIVVTKISDDTTPAIMSWIIDPEMTNAVISLYKKGNPPAKNSPDATIELTNVLLSSYEYRGVTHGDVFPVESFSLNFTKIIVTYSASTSGASNKAGYDLAVGKKV